MKPGRPRKDEKEMEKCRGKQEKRDRPGVLDEEVDPPVRRRSQSADEKEQEENAHHEEDAHRAVVRTFFEDEEPDREKEKPEDRFVEIRRIGQNPSRQRDFSDENVVGSALDH